MTSATNWPNSLAFIGGGNMARSLIGGMVDKGFDPSKIHVADPNASTRDALAADFGVNVHDTAVLAASNASTWILAVKPQVALEVCASLRDVAASKPLVISILAGTPVSRLIDGLGVETAVVRAMPNTPALIGIGATGLFANAVTSSSQREQAAALLEAVGIVEWVSDESLIDSVTALSGSGPAYVFLLAEALIDAAVKQGLSHAAASALAVQTLRGASEMLAQPSAVPAELRRQVTSPGGTTQAAIESFESSDFRGIVQAALDAGRARCEELGRG